MSLWRWTPHSSFRILLALCLLTIGARARAQADEPSQLSAGPVSSEEAKILWQDGKKAYDQGQDEDAISRLERFVARYPGYPQYFEARHILARAYLRQHAPEKAKAELKDLVNAPGAQGKSLEALQARAELCRADLELKQYSEALLTADELVKITADEVVRVTKNLEVRLTSDADVREAEALMLRARAQIGLDQDARAESSVASALKLLPNPAQGQVWVQIASEARQVQVELKLRHCAKFPSSEKLEEDQVRNQFGRRGTCLLDSVNLFKNVLTLGDNASSESTGQILSLAYASYWERCQHPPSPPPVHPKDRNAQQLKTYFRELAVVLEEDCRQKIHQGLELINSWKGDSPTSRIALSAQAEDTLRKASAELEKLK